MGDNLFEGLPPPSHHQQPEEKENEEEKHEGKENNDQISFSLNTSSSSNNKEASPTPVLKSAFKRPKPSESNPEAAVQEKRLRFKMTTDASETQVIEAMQKIASHIKNPTKFSKASKLAIQLVQAGSVKVGTSEHFFAILEAAMSSTASCTDSSVRGDYHSLFSAAQDAAECLNKKQKNQLTIWTFRAVMANDFLTDDSFVFSKTASKLKDEICSLPFATEEDDIDEAATLKDETETGNDEDARQALVSFAEENNKDESDPFGLDALIPRSGKNDDRAKGKKDVTNKSRKDDEEYAKRFLQSKREALISCLEIAARRYKTPWCQTVIDILVKHAFDNVARFTSRQRDAIEKLWASVREKQIRRKQGKSVSGKLDVNAFEWLQQKYSTEKISIRHSVGASGDRRCQQWLG
ncbi:methyltransferase-like protein 6-like [Hibiscus syriacus]|uniref:Methyltransferase-like protein 6-like n=1 Tax=Hibiscus syriacus TaxID=106335 RepID=A0A6A3CF96_HIBSY|nr:uncharacterized protein LOC120201980 [Hibiscus syriacus]KAE8725819.1 methyltransferase-like protein 6-like [Hibiscus syriacus]